jgi:NhaA family Na+:H+ antiporter
MKAHAVARHTVTRHTIVPGATDRQIGARVVRFVVDRFLLLPIGAAIALVWANTAGESYFRFAHALAFPVNEIGMALFLALIGQEVVEAVMPGGALHTWRKWGLPILAAAGGMIGAAGLYLAYVNIRHQLVLEPAWPIACAIDIAAGYYVLKLIAPRSGALPFLLVLAITTNVVGLVIVGWRPPVAVGVASAGLILVALGIATLMRRAQVRRFWPYLAICGPLSWAGFYGAGIHPALALLPVVPFLPHRPRTLDLFADPPDDDAVHHAEHRWNEVVQVVLFLFGLVNAGVLLRGYDTGTWALLAAALVGRPVGIVAAVALGHLVRLELPRRVGWRQLMVIAFATSSGFTLALFFATSALAVGPILAQIKIGALLTVLGALITVGAAHTLRVGRFAR